MRAGFGRPLWCAMVLLTAFVAVGCHKKESVIPPVEPTATPTASPSASPSASPTPVGTIAPTSAQTSTTLNNSGGTVMLSSDGLSGTLTYPGNSGTGSIGAAFTMSSQNFPTLPSPQPTGTSIVAFTLQLSATTTFSGPLVVTPVSLPSSFSPNGAAFYETLYDTTAGVQLGTTATGTVSGQSVAFPPSTSGTFGATAGDVYAFIISYGSGSGSSSTGGSPTLGHSRRPPR